MTVSGNYATTGGTVTDDGHAAVTTRGVCWSTSPNPTLSGNHTSDGAGLGGFTSILSNLTPNTTYYVRAYATNSVGTAYGEQLTFTTQSAFNCGTSTVADIDNNSYNTVQIGLQCWMKENMRVTHYADGTDIPSGGGDFNYYRRAPNNDESNVPTYGFLYSWNTAMHGAASSNDNPSGVQGICPIGWHVPSVAEWEQLVGFLTGQTQYACDGGANAIASALAASSSWFNSSVWCTPGDNNSLNNASGFSALPAGYMPNSAFNFGAYFWSSTQSISYNAYNYVIFYNNPFFTQGNQSMGYANSVRCLRDELGGAPMLPSVTTDSLFAVTPTKASYSGRVTSDGGAPVTARGICWSTSPNPTLLDGHTSNGAGVGSFIGNISNLTAGTTYYVRAYASTTLAQRMVNS